MAKSKKKTSDTKSENVSMSLKKFRQSPEAEAFYRFIHEHSLQKEAYGVLTDILIKETHPKHSSPPKNPGYSNVTYPHQAHYFH